MKKNKVLKIILIVVLVLIAIVAIYILRNYIIISKISNKQKELANKTNYYYKFETYGIEEKDDKTITECYYKDGKGIEKYGNQKYGYCIEWFDNNTKEKIVIDTSKSTAKIYEGKESSFMLPIVTFDKSTVKDKLEDSISYITYEDINGKKCYKIKPLQGVIITSNIYYINAENGAWARISMGNIKGNENNIRILDYIDYKFDEVTDEDVKRPDLTGYEVTYYNENGESVDKRRIRRNKTSKPRSRSK